MARVLFVTWDGGGNVPPALGIAVELRRRGHRVRFLGHAQQRDRIEGFDFAAYAHARPWSSTAAVDGPWAAVQIIGMFTDRGPGTDLLAELDREPADLLVVDCMSLGALRAAHRTGVPTAALVHTLHRYVTHRWSRGPVGLVAGLRGLRPTRLWDAAGVVLVTADPALDPTRGPLPANVRHTGVVQAAPRPADRDGEPLVLVSLSTTYFPGQAQTLQAILDALVGVPARAVVTIGDAVDPAALRPPAGVEVHRFPAPRRGDARRVAGDRARRPRDDHARAGPRPAAARAADAPDARPADGRRGGRGGRGRAGATQGRVGGADPRGRPGTPGRRPTPGGRGFGGCPPAGPRRGGRRG